MMTLEEMKLAVCEKLPELFYKHLHGAYWRNRIPNKICSGWLVHWPTEGLQICHEAEKFLNNEQSIAWEELLMSIVERNQVIATPFKLYHASFEQRLEALCHVWYPEKFETLCLTSRAM